MASLQTNQIQSCAKPPVIYIKLLLHSTQTCDMITVSINNKKRRVVISDPSLWSFLDNIVNSFKSKAFLKVLN